MLLCGHVAVPGGFVAPRVPESEGAAVMRRAQPRRPWLRKPWLGAVVAATLGLALAGCGSGSGGDGDGAGAGKEAGAADQVTLTIWFSREHYQPPDRFKKFMAEHPNIKVLMDVQDNDDELQQLLRRRDAGQALPDIIHDDVAVIPTFAEADLIQPLDKWVERWQKEDPDSFGKLLPSVWTDTEIDGKKMGMSVTANLDVFYYNVPWFAEAGVKAPLTTMDDIYAALQQLKKAHPDKFPLAVQALAGEGVTALKRMLQAVGTPFDGATPDLTSPGGQYVLDWYVRARQDGLLNPDAITWGEAESRGAFMRGDAAMIADGLSTGSDLAEVENFPYGEGWATNLIPVDSGEGNTGERVSESRTFAMTTGTKHPYEASLALRYLADAQNLVEEVVGGAVPPRNTDALADPAVAKALPHFTDEVRKGFTEGVPAPAAVNAPGVEEVLEQLFGEIVTNKGGGAKALAAKYQPLLDKVE